MVHCSASGPRGTLQIERELSCEATNYHLKLKAVPPIASLVVWLGLLDSVYDMMVCVVSCRMMNGIALKLIGPTAAERVGAINAEHTRRHEDGRIPKSPTCP